MKLALMIVLALFRSTGLEEETPDEPCTQKRVDPVAPARCSLVRVMLNRLAYVNIRTDESAVSPSCAKRSR